MISREFSAHETSPRHDLPESTGQFAIEEVYFDFLRVDCHITLADLEILAIAAIPDQVYGAMRLAMTVK